MATEQICSQKGADVLKMLTGLGQVRLGGLGEARLGGLGRRAWEDWGGALGRTAEAHLALLWGLREQCCHSPVECSGPLEESLMRSTF